MWAKENTSEGHPNLWPPWIGCVGRKGRSVQDGYQHVPAFALVSPSPDTCFHSVIHAPYWSGSNVIFLWVLGSKLKCRYLVGINKRLRPFKFWSKGCGRWRQGGGARGGASVTLCPVFHWHLLLHWEKWSSLEVTVGGNKLSQRANGKYSYGHMKIGRGMSWGARRDYGFYINHFSRLKERY